MIPEKAFSGLLQLNESWEVVAAEFETKPTQKFLIGVRATAKLWPTSSCGMEQCGGKDVVCHDHAKGRRWRHLGAFWRPTEILCVPPQARSKACGTVWTVSVPWEGKGKHFTKDFEAFALTLIREMPVKRAGQILAEYDTRLRRMLERHIASAYGALALSELVHLGLDEMNLRKGRENLTVFADLAARRVVFATEGKDSATFVRFWEEYLRHNGHPQAVTHVAMDMSAAYRKVAMRNATITCDPFHVTALVSTAMDEVRRLEIRDGDELAQESLKGSL